jgi:hypothetical protein
MIGVVLGDECEIVLERGRGDQGIDDRHRAANENARDLERGGHVNIRHTDEGVLGPLDRFGDGLVEYFEGDVDVFFGQDEGR